MEINKKELLNLYMKYVDEVTEECDWKSTFGPEEIVYIIGTIIENNPRLIKTESFKYKITKWFELNLGWLFVNCRKQDKHIEYLKNKYGER